MDSHQVFAYQPIVDANRNPVAVELIHCGRDGEDGSAHAVANMVLNAVVHAAPQELPRQRVTYFNAPAALLDSPLLDQLPAQLIVLELTTGDALQHLERCRELRSAGYRLALTDISNEDDTLDDLRGLMSSFDIARFDAAAALRSRNRLALMPELLAAGMQLLAANVDHADMLPELRRAGFSQFQGYHFTHPAHMQVQREDTRKFAVLDLLAKLSSDADDRVIEEAFKSDPALSLHLLRIVNSSAYALKTRIRSIKHALAILGRKQLERWLQVLLFALDGDGTPSPLMELALRRGRFMEFVLIYRTHQGSTALQDEAYMTGLLSLVDVLLGWTMEETVERINVADEIRRALLTHEGALGQLIELCETLEAADFDKALPIAEALRLPLEAVMTAQNVALSYSEHVGQSKGD